jgi:O-antigen biosynthesis protein
MTIEANSMNKIAVLILTINQRDRTLKCLESLLADQQASFKVLVWDNGSNDGTAEAIRYTFPHILVREHPGNLGVASGRTAAAKLAISRFQPTHLLFLDNDILVEPGFVQSLYQPFTQDSSVGQTQAKLRFMHDRQRINDGGGARINFLRWKITPVGYGEIDYGQYDRIKECISCGGAMMVRTDVFQQLGGFDNRFDPFGPEDLDFSLRLQKAGYKALYVPQAIGYHRVSHTFGEGYTEDYARNKIRHWMSFMRRHAPISQQAAFYLIGAPYLTIQVLVREGMKGNWSAIKGLIRGGIGN